MLTKKEFDCAMDALAYLNEADKRLFSLGIDEEKFINSFISKAASSVYRLITEHWESDLLSPVASNESNDMADTLLLELNLSNVDEMKKTLYEKLCSVEKEETDE